MVHHYRLGGSILVSLQLFEIQPDRVGHQVTYLILGFPGDANTWLVHGPRWGDGGFAYASDAYAASAFDEAYGAVL